MNVSDQTTGGGIAGKAVTFTAVREPIMAENIGLQYIRNVTKTPTARLGTRGAAVGGAREPAEGIPRLRAALVDVLAVDIRSLAALRIGVALAIIVSLVHDIPDIGAFWTDDGLIPRIALLEIWRNPWLLSVHLLNGTWLIQALLILVQILLALGLLVGYRTRIMTVGSWFLLISLQTRNPIILQGGDVLLHLLLFWGIFLPWDACWSLDARGRLGGASSESRILTGGSLAYLVQIICVYVTAALLKTGAAWRSEGSAVYYALSINQIATPFGHWLLHFPNLLRFLTFSTLLFEGFGSLLFIFPLWNGPVRTAAIATFMFMHLGFQLAFRIGFFPAISIVALLGLLPSWFWDAVVLRLLARDSIRSRTAAVTALLRRWQWPSNRVSSKSSQAPLDGRPRNKAGAGHTRTARHSEVTCSGWRLLNPGFMLNALPLFFVIYVCIWNLSAIDKHRFHLSDGFQSAGWLLRLDQDWGLFAPFPFRDDGWYVIPGVLENGQTIDVYRNGAAISYDPPEDVLHTFKNYRWWKYLNNLYFSDYSPYRLYYAQYLCRQWNTRHEQGDLLRSFQIVYMRQTVQPNFQPRSTDRIVLWEHQCF